jgi:periplasmic copper chaperone A
VPAVKVAVQLPPDVSNVSFTPAPGWKRTLKSRVVTWSGGEISEGKFGRFLFNARMPDAPGTEVLFPTVQTYANGKVVHWIGEETSDTPAPRIRLMAAKQPAPPPPPVTTTAATPSDDDGGGGAVLWIVLAAAIALALGATGLMFWRRRA